MGKNKNLSGTTLIHGDRDIHSDHTAREVAPSISVTTTFKSHSPDEDFSAVDLWNPSQHVYSRYSQQTVTRVEHVLSKINGGYALTYSSGLAAAYAALVFYKPKRVAINQGYVGTHSTLKVYQKSRSDLDPLVIIDLDDAFEPGDICWLETPLNPTGETRDIKYYADKIHKVGGKLIVDATFGPPPLQYPFKFGADCVHHSGTKYFGGHSDLLCGVLVVRTKEEWHTLQVDRTYLGSVMGSLEAWLLLRSLRTLHLRIPRQSENAAALAQWLNLLSGTPKGSYYDGVPGGIVKKVWHSSLQRKDASGFDPIHQMEGGWNATFSILLSETQYAKKLPHELKYFTAATSLGGVESLVEYRQRADPSQDPRLVRISVGVEDLEDLKDDLREALRRLANGSTKAKL